jgi:hypothetical protein
MNSRVFPALAAALLVIAGLIASEKVLNFHPDALIGAAIGIVVLVGLVAAVALERQR